MHNATTPNWTPLERAVELAKLPKKIARGFMWMCEQPQGLHQYKHADTRNYAMLCADSTPEECRRQLDNALTMERPWGKAFDRMGGGTHA